VAEGVIVPHVRVKAADVSYEALPLFLGDALAGRGILQKLEVFALEVELEEDEKGRGLI
jgi:hypothetical protein